jgi:membrane-bound serine protease (ClpP class)
LSIVALALLGYSLYEVFAKVGPEAGMFFVLADVIMIPVLTIVGIKILARSPIALRRALSRSAGVSSQDESHSQLIGKRGVTVTDLRPAGKALVDGQRLDVVSAGDYIASGTPVSIAMVNGNRIVVREAPQRSSDQEA